MSDLTDANKRYDDQPANASGWDHLLASAKRRGEDLDDKTYMMRLREVWETRGIRVRGFRGWVSSMPGECGICYRENVPEDGVHICAECLKDPKNAEIARKLA